MNRISFIGFMVCLMLGSCTVEKRVHLSGYHVQWKKRQAVAKQAENSSESATRVPRKSKERKVYEYGDLSSTAQQDFAHESTSLNQQLSTPEAEDAHRFKKSIPIPTRLTHVRKEAIAVKRRLRKGDATPGIEDRSTEVEGLGLASMILGIVGLLTGFLGVPLGILAVIFAAISMGRHNKNPEAYTGQGFAIAGLVLGIVSIVWGFFAILLVFALLAL